MTADEKWQDLLARSAPTFSAETNLPFGLMTGTLARLRQERRGQIELERMGWRALFAALAVLLVVGGMTLDLQLHPRNDLEPGIRGVIEMENVPLS